MDEMNFLAQNFSVFSSHFGLMIYGGLLRPKKAPLGSIPFHQYHWFARILFSVGCADDTENSAVFCSGPLETSGMFHDNIVR